VTTAALRVLIVAEHASKRLGGEAILPYHLFRVLRSRGIDAWLVVHERTRAELTVLFPEDRERIRFVRDQTLQKLFYRASLLLPRRIAEATLGLANQLLTQWAQRPLVRALATQGSILHQPIPVSPRFPSLLAGQGSPLIVGPLNGGMEYPPAFRGTESRLSRMAIALGRSLSALVNAAISGKKNAAVVFVANERTRAALPSGLRGKIIEVPENGVDLTQWISEAAIQPPGTPSFLFMGRLVDWKALELALEAIARIPGARLDVIGDGPMLNPWRSLTASLNLADRVTFHGWLPQDECAHHLRTACALVLPSLYECGGAVVLEAMASAKPVIATAWGGPADYLDESCGFLIPPANRETVIAGFAQAMAEIMRSPGLAAQMGAAGRARVVAHFDWEKKVDAFLNIYASLLPVATPVP
jgi:glycosyltransferase involved in cell wall biosynthesis